MPGGRHALLPLKEHDSSTYCLRAIPYRLFNSNASPKSNDNGRRVSLLPEYIPFHWLRASSSRVKGMMGHHLRWSVTYKSGKRRWSSRIRLNFVRRVGSHKSLPSCWCCPNEIDELSDISQSWYAYLFPKGESPLLSCCQDARS